MSDLNVPSPAEAQRNLGMALYRAAERANKAEAVLERIRELHPTREVPAIHSENPTAARAAYTECGTCHTPWPCPTIREINGSTSE